MFAEFNWWLLIVGLAVGAGLAWLVLADTRRHEDEVEDRELAAEALWLEDAMAQAGTPVDAATAEHLLRLHRAYLRVPPSDLDGPHGPDEPATDEVAQRDVTDHAPAARPIPRD